MIFGEHDIGGATITPVAPSMATGYSAIMAVRVGSSETTLTRPEVERFRDLCNEALS